MWTPTDHLLQAEVLKRFTPDNAPADVAKYIKPLYPGDQVYVFETLKVNDAFTWARGYSVIEPLPQAYTSASVDVKRLPDPTISVCIFPLHYANVYNKLPINKATTLSNPQYDENDNLIKPAKPQLPLNVTLSKNLSDEMKLTLKTISSTLFAVYSKNNFEFFEKLSKIYYELHDLRTCLKNNILTEKEINMSKQKVVVLMNTFSKLLASGGGMINKSLHSKSDIDGKESLLARDNQSGELYSFDENIINPAKIAQNQIFGALAPPNFNYSSISFLPRKNDKFVETPPSNIIVDFKQVIGSSTVIPKGYAGMKAYMYLRNAKKRLTEAFCIDVSATQELQLDNLFSALFTQIPTSDVENGKVYLVALLTETIELDSSLKSVRKGICAGVADISRIFSHKQGHLASGQSHRFVIKLFSSFLDTEKQEVKLFTGMNSMMAKSLTIVNTGWGKLVDRIINGSNKGVAINPRAEKLILSIKELKSPKNNLLNDFNNVSWNCIPTLNSNSEPNRIHFKLNKITTPKLNDHAFLTVHVRSSSSTILFSKGNNEKSIPTWKFLSVSPNESVEELIEIRGLDEKPTNTSDYLIFDLYLGNNYVGEAQYKLRDGAVIHDTGINSKTPATLEIVHNAFTATIEFDLEYAGRNYNLDDTTISILNWKSLINKEQQLIDDLSKLKRIKLLGLNKNFSDFGYQLLCIFEYAVNGQKTDLANSAFNALVHLLDVVIIRNNENVSSFNLLLEEYGSQFPKIGNQLLNSMASILGNFENDWNANGRALCRSSYLILKISSLCVSDLNDYKNQCTIFVNVIGEFLNANVDIVLPEQLIIIETLELYLDIYEHFFHTNELIMFLIDWIMTNKLKGYGSIEDIGSNPLINKNKSRKHKFLISKLFFILRVLNNEKYVNCEKTDMLLDNTLDVILSIFNNDIIDIECIRFSMSVYLSILNLCFGVQSYYSSKKLHIRLIKLIPFLSAVFNKYYAYALDHGLFKRKRSYTQIFPNEYPITQNTMDSIVTDVTYVELLVELSILIVYTSKIYEATKDEFGNSINKNDDKLLIKFNVPMFNDSINSILGMISLIVDSNYYPSESWLSLHSISLQASYLLLDLINQFMPQPSNESILSWNLYLKLLLQISTSKPVSIEHLEYTPMKGCYQLTTDLRTKVTEIIDVSWDNLGSEMTPENKARFQLSKFGGLQNDIISLDSYNLLKYIILFTMQRNDKCHQLGIQILWSIISFELGENDSLFKIEREVITSLYDLFENTLVYSPEFNEIENFIGGIEKMLNNLDIEDESYFDISKLIKTISNYLKSLGELKQVPNGEEFDDDRTFHKLNISSYLMNVDKPELFQSFICDLYDNYLEKKSYVQAALSLELLANTWEWDIETYLPECSKPKLPRQTSFKRKVDLFKIIAQNFTKGNKLEQAVEIYNEMLNAYIKHNFDLLGLSFCHLELGKLYEKLEHVDRLESTFFKISFIGLGFPESIRSKEFIYEGLPYEHITSVHNRLNKLYPGSRIINNEDDANKLIIENPIGKFLFIKTIIPKKEHSNNKLSVMARQYVDNKNLNTFINTRRLPGASNITNLWTEEITYKTYMTFPTLMNRSEIKETLIVKIPPIKNAIRSLILKNDELINLEFLINQNLKDNISLTSIASSSMFNNLTRILSGTVDSPVNGGAGQFRIFFTNDPSIDIGESVEEYQSDCMKLKECFNDLIKLLNKLLKLHGLIVPTTLKLQHETLIELFSKNFANEIKELGLDVISELNYNELMKSLTSKNVHSKQRNAANTATAASNYSLQFSQSIKAKPASIHSTGHGSNHGSYHGSHQGSHAASSRRYGSLLGNITRHSVRGVPDDDGNSSHLSIGDELSSQRTNSLSVKKNILNYK